MNLKACPKDISMKIHKFIKEIMHTRNPHASVDGIYIYYSPTAALSEEKYP